MGYVLAPLFGKVVLVLLVLCGIALLTLARIRRRLRVSPHVATQAPLRWLITPLPAARLHRRLQGAVRAVRLTTGKPARLGRSRRPATAATRLAADLEREAVAMDLRLVAVANLGTAERRRALKKVAAEVGRIEDLARRIAELARDEQDRPALVAGDSTLDELSGRVGRLEQARAELTVIETEARMAVPPELSA